MKSVSTQELLSATGITRNKLQTWIKLGYITPSIRKIGVQGEKLLFSIEDVYRVNVFKHLLKQGLKRDRSADMVAKGKIMNADDGTHYFIFEEQDSCGIQMSLTMSRVPVCII